MSRGQVPVYSVVVAAGVDRGVSAVRRPGVSPVDSDGPVVRSDRRPVVVAS
jgi:hypothetical protein